MLPLQSLTVAEGASLPVALGMFFVNCSAGAAGAQRLTFTASVTRGRWPGNLTSWRASGTAAQLNANLSSSVVPYSPDLNVRGLDAIQATLQNDSTLLAQAVAPLNVTAGAAAPPPLFLPRVFAACPVWMRAGVVARAAVVVRVMSRTAQRATRRG